MAFTANSSTDKEVMNLEDTFGISVSFETAAENLARGAAVKLLNTGLVAAVTAAADRVLGFVSVPKTHEGRVTIVTAIVGVVYGQASGGTLAAGDVVDAVGWDATTKRTTFAATVSTGNKVGVVTVGGASGAEVRVALFR